MSKVHDVWHAFGATICISSDEEIAEEFYYSCLHSNRANWSNGTRAAMEIMTHIAKDPEKTKAYGGSQGSKDDAQKASRCFC